MRWNGILATTIVVLLAAASPAAADTFVVTTTADQSGTCATSCSIRQAIGSSGQTSGPDTIQIPAGEYTLTEGPLQITSEVTITGARANGTYIDAAQGSRVFQIDSTSASISHLTMAGGVATDAAGYFGGNLQAQSSTVVLDHVRVTGGHASSGGGVGNRNGSMTITNSLLAINAADMGGGDGGAIVNFGGNGGKAADLTVRDSTIAYNNAKNSGAISQWGNPDDTVSLQSVTIGFNSANSYTGGINPGPGTISVGGSLLAGNTLGVGDSNCISAGIVSLGNNFDDGVSCKLSGPGDRSDTGANLNQELWNDGGETEVLMFKAPSPALDIGGTCSATDQIGQQRSGACDAGAWELQTYRFTSAPEGPTNTPPTFTWTGPYTSYFCSIQAAQVSGACTSPYTAPQLPDGEYTLVIEASDDSTIKTVFRIDTAAPDAPGVSDQNDFSAEPGATFECSLNDAAFAPCASPYSTAGLGPGAYTLAVRAIDVAGNPSAPTVRRFTIGAQQPVPTPVPTPTPSPTQEPVRNTSVAVDPQGTVLIKDKSGKFVPLKDGVVPNGSEIDATAGSVTITTSTGERATFSSGRFKISQSGGITTVTLSQPLDCKKAKAGSASAAAKKPKTRKLWGDGKGKFRTKGSYSAATVRGTKWLVQDTCTTTLTRVAQGVVSVRDDVLKKSFTLRKGKSYVARAKKK